MKLKNRKTGEIGNLNYYDGKIQVVLMGMPLCGNSVLGEYETLAELWEEWIDYEEPNIYWYITSLGEVVHRGFSLKKWGKYDDNRKQMGNYFSSKEEAELAVRKLQAWKRLKEAGLKIDVENVSDTNSITDGYVDFDLHCYFERYDGFGKDMYTLFGGEE